MDDYINVYYYCLLAIYIVVYQILLLSIIDRRWQFAIFINSFCYIEKQPYNYVATENNTLVVRTVRRCVGSWLLYLFIVFCLIGWRDKKLSFMKVCEEYYAKSFLLWKFVNLEKILFGFIMKMILSLKVDDLFSK